MHFCQDEAAALIAVAGPTAMYLRNVYQKIRAKVVPTPPCVPGCEGHEPEDFDEDGVPAVVQEE